MDRVLLIIDDIQYSRHVEMTLRKVGFDVESLNNEFNLAETILTFNPDYVICRGQSSRLSVHSVGRKLKESSSKFFGKVFLIFPDGYKITPDDVTKLRMDLMLFDPMSTLKLAMHLFSFSQQDFEFVRDKLLKFAITDNQFRNYEQQILRSAGKTIDSEIQLISSMEGVPQDSEFKLYNGSDSAEFVTPDAEISAAQPSAIELPQKEIISESVDDYTPAAEPVFPEPASLSQEIISKIHMEIKALEDELPLRIDTYNHITKDVEQNLSSGLKKRQAKIETNKLQAELIKEQKTDEIKEKKHHDDKVRFAQALFKKKD